MSSSGLEAGNKKLRADFLRGTFKGNANEQTKGCQRNSFWSGSFLTRAIIDKYFKFYKCSQCGMPGHNRRKCTDDSMDVSQQPKSSEETTTFDEEDSADESEDLGTLIVTGDTDSMNDSDDVTSSSSESESEDDGDDDDDDSDGDKATNY